MMMYCPKCGLKARWVQYSSGGDGLYHCSCGFVEDTTKNYLED